MKYKYLGSDVDSLKPVTENTIKYSTLKDLNDPYEATSASRHDEHDLKDFIETKLFNMKMKDVVTGGGDSRLLPLEKYLRESCPDPKYYEQFKELTLNDVITSEQRESLLTVLLERKHTTRDISHEQRSQNVMSEMMGILCLSNTCQSFLMWSHYADKHQGYCIGFDDTDGWFDPMNYLQKGSSPKSERLRGEMWSNKLTKVSYHPERIEQPKEINAKNFQDPFFHKSDLWIYEEEYRMLYPLKCSEPHPASGSASDNYPNLKLIQKSDDLYLRKFPRKMIKEIIFGLRCSLETQKTIRNALAGEEVEYYFAIPSSIKYEIIKEEALFDFPYDPLDISLSMENKINKFLQELQNPQLLVHKKARLREG